MIQQKTESEKALQDFITQTNKDAEINKKKIFDQNDLMRDQALNLKLKENDLNELKKYIEDYKQDLRKKEEIIVKLRQDLRNFEEKYEKTVFESSEKIKFSEYEIEALNKKLNDKELLHEEFLRKEKEKFSDQQQGLKENNENFSKKIQFMTIQIQSLSKEKADLEKSFDELNAYKSQIELSNKKSSHLNQKYEENIQKLNFENSLQTKEIDGLKEEIKTLNFEVNDKKAEIDRLINDLNYLEKKFVQEKNQSEKALNDRIQDLITKINKESEMNEKIIIEQKDIITIQASNLKLSENDLNKLSKAIEDYKQDLRKKEEIIVKLRQDLRIFEEKYEKTVFESSEKIKFSENEIQVLSKKLTDQEFQYEEFLRREKQKFSDQLQGLKENNENYSKKIQFMTSQIQNLSREKTAVEKSFYELNGYNSQIETEIVENKKEIERLIFNIEKVSIELRQAKELNEILIKEKTTEKPNKKNLNFELLELEKMRISEDNKDFYYRELNKMDTMKAMNLKILTNERKNSELISSFKNMHRKAKNYNVLKLKQINYLEEKIQINQKSLLGIIQDMEKRFFERSNKDSYLLLYLIIIVLLCIFISMIYQNIF